MEAVLTKRPEHILIFDESERDLQDTSDLLTQSFPDATITTAHDLAHYRSEIAGANPDLVVLSHELSQEHCLRLVHELKLRDADPAVVLVSRAADPKSVAEAYASGCHKCIVRSGPWREELAPAIRHLLRIRRLEEENHKLLAKLTEANILLEEKNKRLDDFSATIAHDIRGPLGGISMKLEYLLDSHQDKLDDKFAELLRRTLQSAERLTAVVQGMYEFARLGAKAAHMTELSLDKLVNEVIADLHFDDSLDIRIGLGELPTLWGNANLLRRVFTNLISNAVKYNDKKEIVINITTRATVTKSIASFIEVCVEDNGPGIAAEDFKEIFSMFTRGVSAKDDKEGLGIGLAVVKRIVELHYGTITVECDPGKGARFVMLLPMEKIDFIN